MPEQTFVEETPGIGGGYPQVRGTRTPVRVLVKFYRDLGDVAKIVELLPHLTPEQVQGALDYYAAHPQRVDEDIARNDRAWAEHHGRPWPA
jgi:uncharacterized protein (DUF433 family)